jgi:acetyltransferase
VTSIGTPAKQAAGLESMFRPRGVAIAGAAGDPSRPGHQVLNNLLEAGYPGHIAVIDPQVSAVLGVPAYPALDHVPGPVEMLILTGPADSTPGMVAEIQQRVRVRKDLKVVAVMAGGFSETGTAEGRAWQAELVAGCSAAGVRVVGPDSGGLIDNKRRLDTTWLTGVVRQPGGVSLLSQRGAMGAWLALEWGAQPAPIGLNKLISLGNMADVSMAEMLDYLAEDTSTRTVGLCLESDTEDRALLAAAGRVAARKPTVVLKVGRYAHGSHADPDQAFRQYGLIRCRRVDDFIVTLKAFDKLPVPLGGRVSVLTNAGGPGAYALDCLGAPGLTLGKFSPATRMMLVATLPHFATVDEPDGYVNMTCGVPARQVAQAVAAVLRDPGVDAVIHLFVPSRLTSAEEVARELLLLLPGIKRHSLDKPYLPVLLAGQGVAGARRLLEENGVPTFGSPDQAAAALAAMVRYNSERQPPPLEAAIDD